MFNAFIVVFALYCILPICVDQYLFPAKLDSVDIKKYDLDLYV